MKKSILCILLLFGFQSAFAAKTNILTSDGLGNIKIGNHISSIPEKVPGLYDRLSVEDIEISDEGGYCDTISVFRGYSGKKLIFTIHHYNDEIWSIDVDDSSVKTKSGFGVNSKTRDILKAGGYPYYSNQGYEGIYFDGVLFICYGLTESGAKKREESYLNGIDYMMTAEDFNADSRAQSVKIWNGITPPEIPAAEGNLSSASAPAENYDAIKLSTNQIILLVVIILAYLAILGHMLYVNYIMGEREIRSFAGSWQYIVIALAFGIGSTFMMKNFATFLFPFFSILLYWFSCLTTRDVYHSSGGGVGSMLKATFGFVDSAPVEKKTTIVYDAQTDLEVSRSESIDYSMKIIAFLFAVAILFTLSYFMVFIAIFNWLRNYIFSK